MRGAEPKSAAVGRDSTRQLRGLSILLVGGTATQVRLHILKEGYWSGLESAVVGGA